MEYSLSDLPRPWLRSYNSKVMCDCRRSIFVNISEVAQTQLTHAVVQLRYPPVRNGQAGEKDKVYESMDVTLFSEVERKRALLVVACPFEVPNDIL
jgi:hypothetical protein